MSCVTVAEFHRRWTTDPLFARPKESTNIHNRERTHAFVSRFGSLALDHIDDAVVAEWLAGGKSNGTVPTLRAMFNDAMSAKAGRLIERNPFAGLGLKRAKGNRDRKPPTQDGMERLVALAREMTPPSFAAYLEFAMVEGPRPSELDALRLGTHPLGGWVRCALRVVEAARPKAGAAATQSPISSSSRSPNSTRRGVVAAGDEWSGPRPSDHGGDPRTAAGARQPARRAPAPHALSEQQGTRRMTDLRGRRRAQDCRA
jgi:hypothetical protein